GFMTLPLEVLPPRFVGSTISHPISWRKPGRGRREHLSQSFHWPLNFEATSCANAAPSNAITAYSDGGFRRDDPDFTIRTTNALCPESNRSTEPPEPRKAISRPSGSKRPPPSSLKMWGLLSVQPPASKERMISFTRCSVVYRMRGSPPIRQRPFSFVYS